MILTHKIYFNDENGLLSNGFSQIDIMNQAMKNNTGMTNNKIIGYPCLLRERNKGQASLPKEILLIQKIPLFNVYEMIV